MTINQYIVVNMPLYDVICTLFFVCLSPQNITSHIIIRVRGNG